MKINAIEFYQAAGISHTTFSKYVKEIRLVNQIPLSKNQPKFIGDL